MENWKFEQVMYIIIAVFVLIGVTIAFLTVILKKQKARDGKFSNVLFPKTQVNVEKEEKNSTSLSKKIDKILKDKHIDEKITSAYLRAGMKDKTSKDFILDCLKCLVLGVSIFFLLYYTINNIFIALLTSVVFAFYEPLNIYSKIKQREKEFMYEFPYFLQTIAFILRNGTNFSQAFSEAAHKQNDGVLKEVMLDVLTIQTVNAGDYKIGFQSIAQKIKVQEVLEFVNIVVDNIEKGVSVADIFLQQAEGMDRLEELNVKRKIKAASTKILFPILFMCVSLALLLINF